MEYKFVSNTISGKHCITMEFKEPYSILTNIFMDIALGYSSKSSWLKAIDDTIEGTLVNGNFGVQSGFGAEVGKEITTIYCDFTDEEIEITTNEFKKISEEYFNKLEEIEKHENILD